MFPLHLLQIDFFISVSVSVLIGRGVARLEHGIFHGCSATLNTPGFFGCVRPIFSDLGVGWMPALLLCPKCGSQSIGLVPKRTIPLGGMVALGRFPQEEWFPPPLIWHRKGRQRGEHRRRKTKNRTSFEFENMKSIRTRVGRVSLEKQSRNACTKNAGAQ